VTPSEIRVLLGWGMATHARSRVYRPLGRDDVVRAICDARERGLSVAARGGGLSYGDAALNEGGAVLDLSGMKRILAFDAERGVVRAEAGATIEDLWQHGLPHGWWPPVVPGTMKATLGGCVAMNVHGKNHAEAGAIGRHVEALTLVTGEGEVREVRRGAASAERAGCGDPTLDEVIGAQGLTGTLVDVTLRMRRVHSGFLDVEACAPRSLPETLDALDRGAREADYSVGWLDCSGSAAGRSVVHHARYLPEGHGLTGRSMRPEAQALPGRILGVLPAGQGWRALRPLMNRPGVRLLNAAKFRAAAIRGAHRYTQEHAAFHFLLDYVPNWKRAYGAHGLIQYQMFVPAEGAREAFADAMHEQRRLGVLSSLAVMKRHTREEVAAASYAVDGYSLAMDFAVGRGRHFSRLMRLCRTFDRILQDYGGRVYAAKDAVGLGLLPERRDPAFSSNLVRRWERGKR
jgi:FAD/FMN-containing dehydrogenase